jgi:uncharacterized protein (UPF0335 family)
MTEEAQKLLKRNLELQQFVRDEILSFSSEVKLTKENKYTLVVSNKGYSREEFKNIVLKYLNSCTRRNSMWNNSDYNPSNETLVITHNKPVKRIIVTCTKIDFRKQTIVTEYKTYINRKYYGTYEWDWATDACKTVKGIQYDGRCKRDEATLSNKLQKLIENIFRMMYIEKNHKHLPSNTKYVYHHNRKINEGCGIFDLKNLNCVVYVRKDIHNNIEKKGF